MKSKLREPVNSLTHLGGAALSVIGLVIIVAERILTGTGAKEITGAAIFGVSLILLYLASGIYHGYIGSEKSILTLKKLDHSMIYVLIAGTYTPVLLSILSGWQRVAMLGVIWGIAALGIILKIFVNGIPRAVYTLGYILMGWIVIFFIKPIYLSVPFTGFMLLALGGLLYTIGGFIYIAKKPNFALSFGFHELFHLFILGGSILHYFFIFGYMA